MADPPSLASPASQQPDQLAASDSIPPNSNPQIPLPPIVSSVQVNPASAVTGGRSTDLPPQLQAPSRAQAAEGAGGFGAIHRSGQAPLAPAVGQPPRYATAGTTYATQMTFPGGGGQLRQQPGLRAAMFGQGQPRMLQGQGNAASAAQYELQFQPTMMAQPGQRGVVQGVQFNTPTAQAQSMGASLMNQMRPNGITTPYGAQTQQRSAYHAQMRPQQQPGSSQNGPVVQMLPTHQMQSAMASPASPHQRQQEQMMQLIQQLQQRGLNRQQIAQALQRLPHLNAQHLNQQQRQQQQASPRMPASSAGKPANMAGSQPATPSSGGTAAGANAPHQGGGNCSQLLGKRKIHDLVAQVDPLCEVDPEVEDLILEIADDFINTAADFACRLAKHRKSSVVEAKDVLLHLQKNCHLSAPGFPQERM
ncbi:transcription initiation factor TFIID subunit 12b-like [Triticum dicoccoides]|uniref:transcription initiation factor TFIID subunit 12b-like n=1 Tax=Triticum dicoccoides TaxID=85692 RepID=UPI00189163DF|nr:transcription initiation factor TFIID subunit 12b-like [Triticum dicoccoides]